MSPEAAKYLWDALTASERIQRFISGKTNDDYLADELLRSGVERQPRACGDSRLPFRMSRQCEPVVLGNSRLGALKTS